MAWLALGAAEVFTGFLLSGIIGLRRRETVSCYKCKVELLKTSNYQTEDKSLAGEAVTVITYHSEDNEIYYFTKKVGSSLQSLLSEGQYICSDCFLEVLWILQMSLFDSSILNSKSKRLQFLEWMYELRGGLIAHTEPYYQLASFTGSLSPSVSSESDPESSSMLPVLPLPRQELTYSSEEPDSSYSLSPSVSSESDPESSSMLPVLPLPRQELTYSSEEPDSSYSLSPSVSSESDPESSSMLPVLPLPRQELTYSTSGSEEPDSSSEDDEEQDEEVRYGGAWKYFSSVLDEVIKLHSSGYVTDDRDLQSAYQACFISCYAAAYDLDDLQIEVLLEEINYIGCGLSSFDFFKLTKAMGIMCKNVFSSPKLISFNDVSQFYFDLLKATDLGGCYATTNICLREFIKRGGTVKCSEELQTLIVETLVSSPWTAEEVLKLFFTISHDLQSFGEILQLVIRYQVPFGDIELKLEPKYLLNTLARKYGSYTSKSLQEVMENLSKSGLLDHNISLLTEKIVRKVLETPLDDYTLTKYDALRILRNEESDLEQRIEANATVVSIIYHSVRVTIEKTPTVTQLASVCILLVSHQEKVKRLLEVLTGEGKSLIIAMFAAALALLDKKVDILTSTPDLAQRDVQIFQEFYQFLGLTVSHNTETEEILDMRPVEADKKRLAIYRSNIVYGTVNDFSGDLLRQEFEMRNVRGDRKMAVAIVDEMDMLMLDKGMQFTYLSHHSAIMHHVEPVLALVWSNVCQTTPFITTSGKAGVPKFIHDVIFEGVKAGLRSRIGDSRKMLQVAANMDFIDKAVLHTICQNVSPVMKKSAMSQFRTASMIQFVKYLQMEYIPCNIAVYISNSTGELVRQDGDESFGKSGTIPEFSLLILDEGLACPLYTQSKLANGILRMVAVHCDLPLKENMNPEKTLKTVEGKEFYEGQTNFFHDVIFRCMHEPKFSSAEKMLYLAVKYNLLSDSQVSRFIFARDKAEQNELMKNLTTLHLTAFINQLNKELPLRIIPYTLDRNQKLVPSGELLPGVVMGASIPVLIRDKGILQPLYPYEWVDGASSTSYCAENGTRFWLGDCKFFHEGLFHSLQSEHMLFLAGKLDLISKYDIKQFFLAKDHRSKRMALQNVGKEQILELMKYIEAPLPYKFIIYTFEDGDIQMARELNSDETNKTGPVLLINEPGTMCQLQPKETVDIPGFLQQFVVNQLPTYIQSAFTALLMTEEREYMVKNVKIVPIDFTTSGLIETNKRWGGGLQQMLEMKHLLKLTPISITTNFISHLYFFARYNSLYGLSGTVGLKCEQGALNVWYSLRTCKIPPCKEKRFFERKGLIVSGNRDDWKNEIQSTVVAVTDSRRAALVLCEDIRTCKEIYDYLRDTIQSKVYCYFNSENSNSIKGVRSSGDIIVATNLAGRGTDITVSDEVIAHGGLFCILTFLPTSTRVESQAFGRAARNGNPGSAQLILHESSLPNEYRGLDLAHIRRIRALKERERLDAIRDDIKLVILREKLFAIHCSYLKYIHDTNRKDKAVLAECINESWGQWLLTKQGAIMELKEKELKEELHGCHDHWSAYFALPKMPSHKTLCNFTHLVKLGNRLAKSGLYGEKRAIEFYTRAIEMELMFSRASKFVPKGAGKVKQAGEKSDLQTQMEVRLNVLDFVHKKIGKALEKIKEFKEKGDDFEAIAMNSLEMIPNLDQITEDELLNLSHLGLEIVFAVKKKPRFSWGAVAVFVLGLVEIVAGVVVTAVTFGAGTEIGMGLIAEGVSDCIDGTIGMITGEFSWSQWATMKAVSIAVSIATFGVGKFIEKGAELAKDGVEIARETEKASTKLVDKEAEEMGMKELPEVAEREEMKQAEKFTLKDAAKAVGKEVVEQGMMYGLGELENLAMEKIVEKIAEAVTKDCGIEKSLMEAFSGANPLGIIVDRQFVSRLPADYIEANMMSPVLEKEAIDFFSTCVNQLVSSLVSDSPEFGIIMTGLADLIHNISGKLKGKASLVHLIELVPVGIAITRVSLKLDKVLKTFEPMLVEKVKDPKQTEDIDSMKSHLSRRTALALAEAIIEKLSRVDCFPGNQKLSPTQKEAVENEIESMTEQLSSYYEPSLHKSFSDDEELGGVVKILFVCRPQTDQASICTSATKFFEEAVKEVMQYDTRCCIMFGALTDGIKAQIELSPSNRTRYNYTKVFQKYTLFGYFRLCYIPTMLCEYCEKHIQTISELPTHTTKLASSLTKADVHRKLHSQCTKFFAVHGEEEHQPLPRHLQCAEVLKRELARQATCAFTETVSTIILQNLGWVANQHLNRKINIVAARTVTTGTRKAAELVVKNPVRDVSKHGEKLADPQISGNEADLRVASKLFGCRVRIVDEELQSERLIGSSGEVVELRLDKEGKYRVADEREAVAESGNGLLDAFSRGLKNNLPRHEEVTAAGVRKRVAHEISSSPRKWVERYQSEKKREMMVHQATKVLDRETLGTVAEIEVVEKYYNLRVTVVDKDGNIKRRSKQKTGRDITLVHTKDRKHQEGHYSIGGLRIETGEFGNCLFESLAHEMNEMELIIPPVDSMAIRRAISREIQSHPDKWYGLYSLKEKYENSWLFFRRNRLLKGAGVRRKHTSLNKVLKKDDYKSRSGPK
jgi:hypothetical protein